MDDPTSPPIDLEHLSQYTGGDTAIEDELLGMFVPNAVQYVDTMESSGNAEDWHVAAHSLKGVARGVGAVEVAELAEAAEKLEAAPDGERQQQVARLRQALERVRAFVDTRGRG